MSYVTPEELAKQIGREREAQTNPRFQRVCNRATFAINDRLGRKADFEPVPDSIADIALSLAVDIWKQPDATFGIMGLSETGPVRTARDLVARYEAELVAFFDDPAEEACGWGVA